MEDSAWTCGLVCEAGEWDIRNAFCRQGKIPSLSFCVKCISLNKKTKASIFCKQLNIHVYTCNNFHSPVLWPSAIFSKQIFCTSLVVCTFYLLSMTHVPNCCLLHMAYWTLYLIILCCKYA